jgi:hypothetical protein
VLLLKSSVCVSNLLVAKRFKAVPHDRGTAFF